MCLIQASKKAILVYCKKLTMWMSLAELEYIMLMTRIWEGT